MLVVALATGFGASFWLLDDARLFGTMRLGPWVAVPATGDPNLDPYSYAHLIRAGRLQLGRGEGLRFSATTDSDGAALETRCDYVLEGATPASALWTLFALAPDGSLLGTTASAHVFSAPNLPRQPDGTARIRLSRTPQPGNWLHLPEGGGFRVVLSLYDTGLGSGTESEIPRMPAIIRQGCA